MKLSLFLGALALGILALPFASHAAGALQAFDASATSLNHGQAVTLSWKASDSSGVVLTLPCVTGIRYKNQSDLLLACDQKITGLGVNDSYLLFLLNNSGGTISVSPKLIPLNPDGSQQTAAEKKVAFNVGTNPQPITSFSASSQEIKSGETVTLSWSAPDIEALNMTVNCTSEITVAIAGDSRPRVPCEQLIFLSDVGSAGSQGMIITSSLLGPAEATFRLLPKITGGGYDGTHAKNVTITVKPVSQTREPMVERIQIDPSTLDSGQEATLAWTVKNGAGANFKISCNASITATSSKTTGFLPCNTTIFPSILGVQDLFRIAFRNSSKDAVAVDVTIIPAISATELDAVRARTVGALIRSGLGDPLAVSNPATGALATSTNTNTATAAIPGPLIPQPLFSKKIVYGARNSTDVKKLQEILKADGVFSGEATGNFFNGTREAVRLFQAKHGIQVIGLVGPQTIEKLNEVAENTGTNVSSQLPSQASPTAGAARILALLKRGNRSEEVTLLQKILASDSSVYPEGTISGFFGPATEAALKRFQAKYGLGQVGFAGPKTRAKLNELAESLNIQ